MPIYKMNGKKDGLHKWKMNISEQNLSVVTRQNIYGEFRAMLNYAVRSEYCNQTRCLRSGTLKMCILKRNRKKSITTQPLMIVLNEQKERQKQLKNFSDDFRVCGGESCLRDSSLDNKNRQYAEGAGLHHIRIHDFRHSHASLLANEGINIQEVARRLGHSDVNMTWNTYSHLYPREEERALKILNEIKF